MRGRSAYQRPGLGGDTRGDAAVGPQPADMHVAGVLEAASCLRKTHRLRENRTCFCMRSTVTSRGRPAWVGGRDVVKLRPHNPPPCHGQKMKRMEDEELRKH